MLKVCRVFVCVRHGSIQAEKWTSVSPWEEVVDLVPDGSNVAVTNDNKVGRCRLTLSNPC